MTTQIDREAVAIGRAVHGAVTAAGLSLAEAAEQSAIPLTTFSRRVNGRLPFTFPELVRVARISGVSVTELATSAERILQSNAGPASEDRVPA
ncbi:helix-turn-helix transcriptional regulator [Nocardioides sp. R-C-SC26]|uniref:helix-turn-helix domain-containing protein n=1 Tax=Nocardioides sp. R-C-SC26 TaxID=2870414 RepID=UPI001E53DD60|nr:helix-turn-helix transcriptional regulator [Nocardioides sp. R-C-SC26]